jgi:hypothetical protein
MPYMSYSWENDKANSRHSSRTGQAGCLSVPLQNARASVSLRRLVRSFWSTFCPPHGWPVVSFDCLASSKIVVKAKNMNARIVAVSPFFFFAGGHG